MVSIVIPVYRTEKFLYRCVNSIVHQTYKNLEIILVDDGSPDRCPKMCDEIALTDSRIVVVHQPNAGLAGARNTGIEHSSGDYIAFVDSDDWLELDTYAHNIKLINQYNADIVQYQLGYVFNEKTRFGNTNEKIEIYHNKEILQQYLYSTTRGEGGDYSVCVCLFKRNLFNGIRFREGKINEDIDFKYKVFANAHILVNTNLKKYYYFQQTSGISLGGLCAKDFDLYEVGDIMVDLTAKESYGTIAYLGKVKQARTALSLLCKIAYYGVADPTIDRVKTIKKLTNELRGNINLLLGSPIPLSRKVLVVLFSINYRWAEFCIMLAK